jgi:hypothetical protein
MDGRCTSSHENKTFRSRSVVKQKGMVFGFRKTATAVVEPEIDRNFMKILLIGAECFRAEYRWTDMTLLIIALCNFCERS